MDDLVRADAFLNEPRVADAETTTEDDDNDDNDNDMVGWLISRG
jgi:hypothetical protein